MRKFLFYFLIVILILAAGLWAVLNSELFWRWAGNREIQNFNDSLRSELTIDNIGNSLADGLIQQAQLTDTINKNIRGKLTVDRIEGTPFSGWVFKGIKLITPEGEIFHAKAFMLRISFWSIIELAPVIEKMALYDPFLFLEQDQQGRWNISNLYQPKGDSSSSILSYFSSLSFPKIIVEHGQIQVQQTSSKESIRNINVDTSFKIFQPSTPVQRVELEKLELASLTPWGNINLDTRLSYVKHQVRSFFVDLDINGKNVVSLSGSRTAAGYSNINGHIQNVPPDILAMGYAKWPHGWEVSAKFEVHGTPDDVKFSVDSSLYKALFYLKGVLNFAGGKTTYDANLRVVDLTPGMLFALGVPGAQYYCEASPLSMNLHLQGVGLALPPEEFNWQLKTAPLTYKRAKIDQLSLKISGSKVQQTVNLAVCGNFGEIGLKSQGSFFTAPGGDLKLEVVNLEPALLGLKVNSGSFINLDFDGKFSLTKPYVLNNLLLSGKAAASGCVNGYPLDKMESRFTWEKEKLNLQFLQAQVGNIITELKGTLTGTNMDFTIQGKNLPEGDWPVPETLQGAVSWTGTIQGTIADPRYVIQARGQQLAAGSVALQSFTLKAQGQGLPPRDATMDLNASGVKTPAMTFDQMLIRITGAGNNWRYKINASSPPYGPLIELAGNFNLENKSYSLAGRGSDVAVSSISVKSFTVKAQGQGLPPVTGSINVKAAEVKTPAGVFQQFTIEADGQGAQWRYQLKGSSPPPGPLIEVAGNADFGPRPMSVVIEKLHVHLADVLIQNQSRIQVRFSPGLDLPTATLKVNDGTLQVAARLEGDQVSGRLDLRKVSLKILKVKGLTGTIESRMALSGAAANPVLEGEIRLDAVKLKKYETNPVTIVTRLEYRGGTFKVSGVAQGGPEGSGLTWNGKMPMQVSLSPFKFNIPNSGLDFVAKSEKVNLKLLEPFITEISDANVPIALVVNIKGNPHQPDIEAHVSWQQGTVTLQEAGIPYAVSPGSLVWHANKLFLPQLTLTSGGTMVLTANADFIGYQPQRMSARVTISDFKALDRLGSTAWINGHITANGPLSNLAVKGHITIPKATINPALVQAETQGGKNPDIILVRHQKAEKSQEKTAAAKPSLYQNMSIDITVDAPGNVFVKENSTEVKADVELAIHIRVTKKPGEALTEAGTIRSLHGTASVFNREFEIQKAQVTLPGDPKQKPYIEARASHEMDEGTMFIDITGPVSKPQINITSDPPKPTTDLMSNLIFGKPTSDLSQQQFNAQNQALGVLGGVAANRVQNLLGGAIPFIGQVSFTGNEGKFILSRDLAPGFKILLEHRNSPALGGQGGRTDANVVKLQYRINRFLRLQAEQGQRNTGGDIQFKKDF